MSEARYIVSARKYRPESFETLLGQDTIARTLSNSIKRGQLAHAYLFCGPRGVGKTTTARIFAKMINCSNPGPDMEPCGHCESCESFAEGRSYCIHEMDAASNNSVDDIKALMDQVQVPPQVGKYSVYIIDEVHMLSQQAFNAFLKTLEEPPAHAIFILATTEKHKILPTILSRCQTYDFNRISIADMVRNLRGIATKENITIDDESLHVIAMKADGAMRDALTIFDQTVAFCGTDVKYEDVIRNLNVLDYEYEFSLVDSFLAGDYGKALLTFDEVLGKGFNALHFVASLSSHLRDLIVARTAGLEALLELPSSLKGRYREQAEKCPLKFLYDALDITTSCEAGYKAAVNQRLHIEFALMKLSFLMKGVSATQAKPAVAPAVSAAPAAPAKAAVAPVAPAASPAATAPAVISTNVEDRAEKSPSTKEAVFVDKPAENATPSTKQAVFVDKPAENDAPSTKQAVSVDEPAPQPRRRAVKTGASLSLSSMMVEKEAPVAAAENAPTDEVPADELILEKWAILPTLYATRVRLANAIKTAAVRIEEAEDKKTLIFSVVNVAQQQWIEQNLLQNLEGNMSKLLGSKKVKLRVDVLPETEEKKTAYRAEDKARELLENNPALRSLVTDLNLDVK